MEKKTLLNSVGDKVYYLEWIVENPKAAVVIAHGMVEHPRRYDDFAIFLNKNDISVYGIYHIGHGEDAKVLNHMGKGDFDKCVSNINELVELVRKETSDIPVVLLGHSMGSFMSQIYVTRYDNLDALVLSGSTVATPLTKMGAKIASLLNALSSNKEKPSKFMNDMAFGSYNKAFSDAKTDFDWLSRDEEQVKKYIDDEYCGGICSINFYQNLTNAIANMGKKKYIANINKNLPIYIEGGSMDPVSEMGKGLYALKKQYDELGVKDVRLSVYEGARHEILNETNKEEVYENTLKFVLDVAKSCHK